MKHSSMIVGAIANTCAFGPILSVTHGVFGGFLIAGVISTFVFGVADHFIDTNRSSQP